MAVTKRQFNSFEDLFDYYNQELFDGQLPDVMINMSRKKNSRGFFAPERWKERVTTECVTGEKIISEPKVINEISLNPDSLNRDDILWQSTLVHEMCHHWQRCFGKYSGAYHNKEWAMKMISIGLMPSHTGEPGGNMTGQSMTHYILPGEAYEKAYNKIADINTDNLKMPFAPNMPVEIITKKGSKSKSGVKVKYTCACGNNVWGKEGLNLTCDECEEKFEIE